MDLVEIARTRVAAGAFRLQETAKGHSTFRLLRQMQMEQWLPQHRLRQIQQQRLRSLLEGASTHVPYYAELFRQLRFDPRKQNPFEILRGLPFLTKNIIREHLDRLKSTQARNVRRFSTGGSTGAPLIFLLGPTRVSSDVAARLRAESWFGASVTDPEFAIWGSSIELSRQDRLRGIRDRILRTQLLSAFEMNPATMSRYLDEMERQGCRRVFGYPSSIALLCEHAQREGRDLRRLGVKAVFVTAEYLYPHWRTAIQNTFGCPVANGYGGRDSGFIAHECAAGGMHITADRLIVEIVDEEGRSSPAGQTGEIVVTHFDTPEMPFIRYRTGDIAALATQSCPCGRGLPLLERIDGRKTDFVVTAEGRLMHGLSLIYVIRELPGVDNFRITQKRVTEFDVEIVRGSQYQDQNEARIREGFAARLRAHVEVGIRYSDSIVPGPNGKTRHVISEVSSAATESTQVHRHNRQSVQPA